MKELISIIIPVHNNYEYTKECVDSILRNTSTFYELIIINNASSDSTWNFLKQLHNYTKEYLFCINVKIINNKQNLSFSKANNQGAGVASGDYLFCLNNDTQVQQNWYGPLLSQMKKSDVGICGCKLLYPDGRIQHSGVYVSTDSRLNHTFKNFHKDFPSANIETEPYAVTAAALMIKKDLFNKINGYDEDYINAYEDIDLCLRVRESGYKVVYESKSEIIHHESKTATRFKNDNYSANIFIQKQGSKLISNEVRILSHAAINSTLENGKIIYDFSDMTIADRLSKAGEFFRMKYYKEALNLLWKVYMCFPDEQDENFLQTLFICCINTGKRREAYDIYKTFIKRYPEKKAETDTLCRILYKGSYSYGLVSIIIPVHNNLHYTKSCVSSIFEKTKTDYELIIINNASTDATAKWIEEIAKADLPEYCLSFKYVHNKENKRFAMANNQGASVCNGQYILCLNNDTKVTDNWLTLLKSFMDENPEYGACGAKLLYEDSSIQHCGVAFDEYKQPLHLYRYFDKSFPSACNNFDVKCVTAACILIRHDLFDNLNGFNEDFINCFEDVDLCLRINESGNKIACVSECEVFHYESKTKGRNDNVIHSGKILGKLWKDKIDPDAEKIYSQNGIKAVPHDQGYTIDYIENSVISLLESTAGSYNDKDYFAIISNLSKIWLLGPDFVTTDILLYLSIAYYETGNMVKAEYFMEKCFFILNDSSVLNFIRFKGKKYIDLLKSVLKEMKYKNRHIYRKIIAYLSEFEEFPEYQGNLCSIIIPVFNNLHYTQNALNAIYKNTKINYEIIVINNNSTDGTCGFLDDEAKYFQKRSFYCKDFKVVHNNENKRFAIANNQGASVADGEYIICLNNDTEVENGWLTELVKTAKTSDKIAACGSKLIYPDRTVQHAGVVIDEESDIPFHYMQHASFDHPAVNIKQSFNMLTAACLLIKHDIFDLVDGYCEEYINCFEDIDLCNKLTDFGFDLIYCPESVVVHHESKTPGRKDKVAYSAGILRDRWQSKVAYDAKKYYNRFGLELKVDKVNKTIVIDFIGCKMKERLEKAESLLKSRDFFSVIELLYPVYELGPYKGSAELYIYLSLAYENINNIEMSYRFIKEGLNIYSNETLKQFNKFFNYKYKVL